MKCTLHLVLSSALLITACTHEARPATPTNPETPPTQEQPKSQGATVPTPTPTPTPAPSASTPAAHAPAPAANQPSVAAPAITDLGKILATIKDGPTAEAAKGKLDALVQQLQTAKAAVPPVAKDSLGGLGKLATDAAAKTGVGTEVVRQITALLEIPAVKAAIGPTLEKLQGLLQ